MPSALQPYFEWPTLPFSMLLLLVSGYWLMMIVSGIDLDFLDFDLDTDADLAGDGTFLDWGIVGLKWFNVGEVPLMVWLTAFALPAWVMSAIFDRDLTDPSTGEIATAILRDAGVALLMAKAATQPLRGKLKVHEPNTVREMIGRTCVVTTSEVTDKYGQASCRQDGAPLSLNVRTTDQPHPKGAVVEIVDYSPEEHVYFVKGVSPTRRTNDSETDVPA